jgi:hypothetical protein
MADLKEHWRLGTSFGESEAKRTIANHGPSLTWDVAHATLNQAVSAGSQGKALKDFGVWERGCRIMFMLKIRHALAD